MEGCEDVVCADVATDGVGLDAAEFRPLLIEAKATFDLIVCNLPSSLRWDMRAIRTTEAGIAKAGGPINPQSTTQTAPAVGFIDRESVTVE